MSLLSIFLEWKIGIKKRLATSCENHGAFLRDEISTDVNIFKKMNGLLRDLKYQRSLKL